MCCSTSNYEWDARSSSALANSSPLLQCSVTQLDLGRDIGHRCISAKDDTVKLLCHGQATNEIEVQEG